MGAFLTQSSARQPATNWTAVCSNDPHRQHAVHSSQRSSRSRLYHADCRSFWSVLLLSAVVQDSLARDHHGLCTLGLGGNFGVVYVVKDLNMKKVINVQYAGRGHWVATAFPCGPCFRTRLTVQRSARFCCWTMRAPRISRRLTNRRRRGTSAQRVRDSDDRLLGRSGTP